MVNAGCITSASSALRAAAGALALALVLASASCAGIGAARTQSPDPVTAWVNGEPLTQAELDEILDTMMPRAGFHGEKPSSKRLQYRQAALEVLLDNELKYQEAKALGMSVPQGKIENAMKDIEARFAGGRQGFLRALEEKGVTESVYGKKLEKMFLVEEFDRAEISSKVSVAESDMAEYYERHKAVYRTPEVRRIRHIFVSVDPASTNEERAARLERAGEITAKLAAGAEFETLAWDYSDDAYRFVHGDLGMVGKGRLEKPLDDAAFSLPVGKPSGIIETIYGYHILRVEAVREERQQGFDEVKGGIEKALTEERLKKRRGEVMDRLYSKADITVCGPYLRPSNAAKDAK